jgi:hypothetical protein
MSQYTISLMDRSRERSGIAVNIGPVTAATLPGLLTTTGALQAATDALSLATVANVAMTVFNNQVSTTPPTSPWANRETKIKFTYQDTTEYFDAPTNSIHNEGFGKIFRVEVPAPDLDAVTFAGNTDFLVLNDAGPVQAWIEAFEAIALSPYNGSVMVINAELVGRAI